jgi:hypothetical protein
MLMHLRLDGLTDGAVVSPRRASQNEYFKENWISRGVPIVEVIGAEPDPGVEPTAANEGLANEGWLARRDITPDRDL